MKISIVIPVYNEEDQLPACLDAIARQSRLPDEVIVVDNNSSDATLAVARRYSFVTVLSEPLQGVVHARSRGFNAARGDIIARIDADSILPPDWLETVAEVFRDSSVDAASGTALYYGVAAAGLFNAIDLYFRRHLDSKLKGQTFLWGANMAMRRRAWREVEGHLCQKGDQHEDYDIAIHLQQIGGKVVFDERMKAYASSRRIDMGFADFMRYVWVSPDTYAQHKLRVIRYFYPVVFVCAIGYLPARILHKGFDERTGRFSIARLFSTNRTIARVDPTANVA